MKQSGITKPTPLLQFGIIPLLILFISLSRTLPVPERKRGLSCFPLKKPCR